MPFLPKRPTSLSTTPCGSFDGPAIRLDGLEMWPDVSGALYLPDHRALLVADLHFEKGSARAHRGVHLPPYDTRSTLAALQAVVQRYRPQRLISLGDSFHDDAATARLDADDHAAIRQLSDIAEVFWLTGNHDPSAAGGIGGRVVNELALGSLLLRHIPKPGAMHEIAGHLHPAASVVRRGRRLRRKCFVSDGNRLILPAFGAYTGGLSVWSPAFNDLLCRKAFAVWMLGSDRVYRVRSSALIKAPM